MGNTSSQIPSGDEATQLPDMLPLESDGGISAASAAALLQSHLGEDQAVPAEQPIRKKHKEKKSKGKKRQREEHDGSDILQHLIPSSPRDLSLTAAHGLASMDNVEPSPPRKKKSRTHKRSKSKRKEGTLLNSELDDAHVDPALTRDPAVFLEDSVVDGFDGAAAASLNIQPDVSNNLAHLATAAALASPPDPIVPAPKTNDGANRAAVPVSPSAEQQAALQKKSHTFTAQDTKAIDDFLYDTYMPLHNLTRQQLCERIQHKTPKVDAEKEDIAQLWKELFQVLPHRTPRSIRRFCRRRYHNYIKGPWSKEEEEQLAHLYEAKPNKWAAISEELGRSDEDCRDRWRNYVSLRQTQNKDKWSNDERDALLKAVAEGAARSREAAQSKARETGTPFEEKDWNSMVNWDVVSEKLGRRRSRLQCLQKWYKMERAKKNKARKAAIKAMAVTPNAIPDNPYVGNETDDDDDDDAWLTSTDQARLPEQQDNSLQRMAVAAAAQRASNVNALAQNGDDRNNIFAQPNLGSDPDGKIAGPSSRKLAKAAKMT